MTTGTYSSEIAGTPNDPAIILSKALEYLHLGFSPIPLCDPEHRYVWRGHRAGYTDKQGRRREACQSPGKAPMTPAWYQWATPAMTEDDVRRLFMGHRGNVGLALRPGQLVLDVDPRAGGFESLATMEKKYGPLPTTPLVLTGGGGQHFYMTIPLDANIPSGGTLSNAGYPGVEWKTHTERAGQVVAPPSLHVSGNRYIWDIAQALDKIKMAPVPPWLLGLIHERAARERPRGISTSDPSKGRYTKPQIIEFFHRTYTEGERRVQSTGLPRLIGILKSRGVPADRTTAFLKWWQQDHFAPPLSDEAIEGHVNGMYQRYGAPDESKAHAGEMFLRELHHALMDLNPNQTAGEAERVVERGARRRIAKERMDVLYALRGSLPPPLPAGANAALKAKNRLLRTLPNSNGTRKAIFISEQHFQPHKDQLDFLLSQTLGEKDWHLDQFRQCGLPARWDCLRHGYIEEMGTTRCTCKLMVHYGCPSRSTIKYRQLTLTDLEGETHYVAVIFLWDFPVGGDEGSIGAAFENERMDWMHETRKLGQRKAWKGKMLDQSIAFLLGRPHSHAEGRLLLRMTLAELADFEKVLKQLQERLSADKVFINTMQDGESAVLQLMEWSMTNFLGMVNLTDVELFTGFYYAMRGKVMNQGMDELYKMLREVPKEEKPTCPREDGPGHICGRPLKLKVTEAEPQESPREEQGARAAPAGKQGGMF